VFVWTTILRSVSQIDKVDSGIINEGGNLYRLTYVLISANGLVDVAGRKLVQLLVVAENYHGDIDRAKD
jgi:hypothetical protein